MKYTGLFIVALSIVVLLLSLAATGPTGADPAPNIVTTPTVFDYLPLVARNWSPSSAPTRTATTTPLSTPTASPTLTPSPSSTSCSSGSVSFNQEIYNGTDTEAVITVADADMNTDPASRQTLDVQVTSQTDTFGIYVTLQEASDNSDNFSGAVSFCTQCESDDALIEVSDGDRVRAVYSDACPVGQHVDEVRWHAAMSTPTSTATPSMTPPLTSTPTMTPTSTPTLIAGGEEWEELEMSGRSPSPRLWSRGVYDPVNQRMIVFGGWDNTNSDRNDVWALYLTPGEERWEELQLSGRSPRARDSFVSVYDAANQRMIVFSGWVQSGEFYNDVWALDLTAGEERWEKLQPSGRSPTPRIWSGGVYDPINQRMIVFGGWDNSGSDQNDVWALHLTLGEEQWEELQLSGRSPRARDSFVSVYDAANQRMIIFSGWVQSGEFYNDVWALYLTPGEERWEELQPSGRSPTRRIWSRAVYDPINQRMIVFGGWDNSSRDRNDVWALYLTAGEERWEELEPSGRSPRARDSFVSIHDAANQRMIIFSGWVQSGQFYNDTWALRLMPSQVP